MAKYEFENSSELKNCPRKTLCPVAFVNDATISFSNTGFQRKETSYIIHVTRQIT